jgi:NAD(P)-dependent dehydrogenase (short-subunit alcohol dehydrogenase family)
MEVDTRDLPALREAASKVEQEFGGVDILLANAGIQNFHPLLEMEDADWNITIDINVTGTANTLRAFAPHIVKRGGGRIILTSSTQGQHGTLYASAYSASKWAIIGLMKSAALELGRYKITVNALVPGLIDTPLTRQWNVTRKRFKLPAGRPRGCLPLTRKLPGSASPATRGSGFLGSIPRMLRPLRSSLRPTLPAWFRAPRSPRPRATARTSPLDAIRLTGTWARLFVPCEGLGLLNVLIEEAFDSGL